MGLLLALALLALFTPLHSCIDRTGQPEDVRRVDVGADMMVLEPGSIEAQMAEWIKSGDDKTFDFELGAETFESNSARLSSTGKNRLAWVAGEMNKHAALKVQILMPTQDAGPDVLKLHTERIAQLQAAMIGQGIDASRVTVEKGAAPPGSDGSRIVALFSK